MTINATLGEYGARQLEFQGGQTPLRGLEIWNVESDTPVVRNETLKDGELPSWLEQSGDFALPKDITTAKVIGSLRLLYQCWVSGAAFSGSNEMHLSQDNWKSILKKLDLPLSYTFDLANRKHVPTRIILGDKKSNHKISMVCQSPPLAESFMTLALTFDPATRSTRGFYGFQMRQNRSTPGLELLSMIQHESDQVEDPMLILALCYGVWINTIQREHGNISLQLRKVQEQTGLMGDYLRQHQIVESTINFDSVHRNLVLQHAYLTNGIADFVLSLGPATMNAINTIEEYFDENQTAGYKYDCAEIKQYVEHMQVRTSTEMQHRQRMLDRITMYLQVLYNLMQQEIARETKRDSSALKSISLLTMIFLPATAIATIISPFVNNSAQDNIVMNFRLFWAIAGPITLCVVLLWFLWAGRTQIKKTFRDMKKTK